MKILKTTLVGLFLLFNTVISVAQTVKVGGEVPEPYVLNGSIFQSMNQLSVRAKGHDGKEHTYSGVSLAEILTRSGINQGTANKKKTVSCYIQIVARDNYKAVLSMAEIDTAFTDKPVILAGKIDGRPLTGEGPYQLIVTGEKKFGRWVRQVASIELFSLK